MQNNTLSNYTGVFFRAICTQNVVNLDHLPINAESQGPALWSKLSGMAIGHNRLG